MSSARLNDKDDAPPHDEVEALVWIIDRYIDVCEWESVLTCFNEYASIIAAADAASYITCIRHALVAIINCQRNRCDAHHQVPYMAHHPVPYMAQITCDAFPCFSHSFSPVHFFCPLSSSVALADSLVQMCTASVNSGVPYEQGGAL